MTTSFQKRVRDWVLACFGEAIASDRQERNFRFLEEALELVQSLGATRKECLQLVEYVYGRPLGDPVQEVGGVAVTLAALCSAAQINLEEAQDREIARVWGKIDAIREKQKRKPVIGPLPGSS